MATPKKLNGRTPITTVYTEITEENLLTVLSDALSIFEQNKADCQYLYDYYKGKQPILERVKTERPEICNMIVENRAYEIVTFKTGRFLMKDIQYTNRDEQKIEQIDALNRTMYAEGKAGKDRELVDWFHICGHAYRMIVDAPKEDEVPFHVYTIDPMRAFVVYAGTVDRPPVLGVYESVTVNEQGEEVTTYTCYTKDMVYTVADDVILDKQPHIMGGVPIVEYPNNNARLGAFEVVVGLLDAINTAQSNRLDGVEQFVQALLVFTGVDLSSEDVTALRDNGAVMLPNGAKLDYITNELNQEQTQTLVDDLYKAVLTICGMPNRNGGTSTSDNKGAVVLRDGWTSAGISVKETKQYFEASERRMLQMALKIFNVYNGVKKAPNGEPLTISDIDIHFDEGEYENTLEKAQVLQLLLSTDWVHPKNAYAFSNITSDPESAYILGKEYHDSVEQKELELLNKVSEE